MNIGLLIELAWKSAVCAGLALLLILLLERRSAAEKSLIANLAVLALVLMPACILLLPKLQLETPVPLATAVGAGSDSVASAYASTNMPLQEVHPVTERGSWITTVYLALAFVFLAGLALALFRLRLIRRHAELLSDPLWLGALAAAQQRMDFKNGTALLTSPDLHSPVSWGFMRPTIIIDSGGVSETGKAEAIIAHELAHVVRLDWLRLMLGRVAIAFFWFNPLVWMLVRRSHQLCEEAADDAVLRTRIPSADYADLLLKAIRHNERSVLLAANGVAPSRSSLGTRIHHVLDGSRSRSAVRIRWAFASVFAAVSFNGVLAAVQPIAQHYPSITDAGAGEHAASALDRLSTKQTQALARAIRLKSWDARRPDDNTTITDARAIGPLLLALRDDNQEVRAIAVWGLSEVRPPAAITAAEVAELLRDPSPKVRGQAARALGDFGAIGYARAIALELKDPSPEVRRQAAHALGDLQVPSTRPALEAVESDPNADVRSEADWALKQVAEAERIFSRERD